MPSIVFVLIGVGACGFTRGLFNDTLLGLMLDLCLGVIGAVTAGSLFNHITGVETAHFGVASGLVALAGAAMLLAVYHGIFPGIRSQA
jgi:uncharacterized membrane protein YeaQ/YmgE (transglycosylase-associated protein family)